MAMKDRLVKFVDKCINMGDVLIRRYNTSSCVYFYEGEGRDYTMHFSSINCLLSGSCNGLICDSIIIDTASMLKSDHIERVYDFLSAQMRFIPAENHPLVIFLE
jgi:hypothetical protein